MLSQFDLRPRSNGQILDISLKLYRDNFWTFLGIVAVVQLPILIITLLTLSAVMQPFMALMQNPDAIPEPSSASLAINLLSNLNSVLSAVFIQFANAALSLAVASALFGRKITFREAYGQVRQRWKSIIGTAFLSAVVLAAMSVATFLLLFTFVGWIGGYGGLLFYSIAVYPLAMPILMLENASAWKVLRRAWDMVRHHFWRVLWFNIILSVLVLSVQFGLMALFGGILGAAAIDGAMDQSFGPGLWVAAGVAAIGTIIVSMFLLPIRITALTMFYIDLRVRDEGLDLFLATAGNNSAEPLTLIDAAPRPTISLDPLISRHDFFRATGLGCSFIALIAGLMLAFFAIIAAFSAL